ncbi:MAG: TOBE domain-containing protein, partial [Hypericibacter sp.]
VVLGIRPEHLEVVAPGEGIAAEVGVVEPTGASTFVFTQIADIPVCAVLNDRRLPRPGDRIGLAPQLDRIHLFDTETGLRLN